MTKLCARTTAFLAPCSQPLDRRQAPGPHDIATLSVPSVSVKYASIFLPAASFNSKANTAVIYNRCTAHAMQSTDHAATGLRQICVNEPGATTEVRKQGWPSADMLGHSPVT